MFFFSKKKQQKQQNNKTTNTQRAKMGTWSHPQSASAVIRTSVYNIYTYINIFSLIVLYDLSIYRNKKNRNEKPIVQMLCHFLLIASARGQRQTIDDWHSPSTNRFIQIALSSLVLCDWHHILVKSVSVMQRQTRLKRMYEFRAEFQLWWVMALSSRLTGGNQRERTNHIMYA